MNICHGLGGFQTFLLTKKHEIKSSTHCLMPKNGKMQLVIDSCDFSKGQKWIFKPNVDGYGHIIHIDQNKCLSFQKQKDDKKLKSNAMLHFLSNVVKDVIQEMDRPTLEECKESNQNQLWSLNLAAKWK